MKKLIVAAFVLGAFAFASQSNDGFTMNDLKAEAADGCSPKINMTCIGVDGNMYFHFKTGPSDPV